MIVLKERFVKLLLLRLKSRAVFKWNSAIFEFNKKKGKLEPVPETQKRLEAIWTKLYMPMDQR